MHTLTERRCINILYTRLFAPHLVRTIVSYIRQLIQLCDVTKVSGKPVPYSSELQTSRSGGSVRQRRHAVD